MNSKTSEGFGFGKIILFGEHAVVHGSPAIAMSISRGIKAHVSKSSDEFSLVVPKWNLKFTENDNSKIYKAVNEIAQALNTTLHGLQINLDVEIPHRAGLGASAAMAASISRALVSFFNLTVTKEKLFSSVQASEKVFHGKPSGIDASIALLGETLIFSKLKQIEYLDINPPNFLVVHSGEPGDTLTTVKRFKNKLENEKKEARKYLGEITSLVKQGENALVNNDLKKLGSLMIKNHEHLNWFGVSSSKLNQIVDVALNSGALGAKMTGGGGGGCAIVLAPDNTREVMLNLEHAGFLMVEI